jgi:hypothetical protein
LQLYIFAITERQRAINIKTMALPFNTLSLEQGWEVAEWKMQPQRWREAARTIIFRPARRRRYLIETLVGIVSGGADGPVFGGL